MMVSLYVSFYLPLKKWIAIFILKRIARMATLIIQYMIGMCFSLHMFIKNNANRQNTKEMMIDTLDRKSVV